MIKLFRPFLFFKRTIIKKIYTLIQGRAKIHFISHTTLALENGIMILFLTVALYDMLK